MAEARGPASYCSSSVSCPTGKRNPPPSGLRAPGSAWSGHFLKDRVLSDRVVEHEVKIPKKIVREEVIEKLFIVPETVIREEIVEDIQRVRERIVEVARPVIQERIVEVPQIEMKEKIVEVVEKIIQERIKTVPKIEVKERIIEVPKIITQERVVEVPQIEYREVLVEKIVEVPEVREEFTVKEIPVPQYIEKPVPEYVAVEVPIKVQRNIPIPVEATTTFEYVLPRMRPRVRKIKYPVYVPRFVEVPVPAELFEPDQALNLKSHLASLSTTLGDSRKPPSLAEIEHLATAARQLNDALPPSTLHPTETDVQNAIAAAWNDGRMTVQDGHACLATCKLPDPGNPAIPKDSKASPSAPTDTAVVPVQADVSLTTPKAVTVSV